MSKVALSVVLTVAAVVVGTTSSSAHASSLAAALPLAGYGDIAVDEVNKQVFITGGPSSNSVLVTNFSGQVTKAIDSEPGATGLELSADSTKLYVALASGDAISVIDTVTLAETARHGTGARTCPTHLARAGAYVWFGYGCDGTFTGKIGRYNPTTGQPVGNLQGNARFQRAPLLTSSGAATGPLVAGQLALSSSSVQVYSITGDALTAGATGDVVGATLADLDITLDGATLFSAAGSHDRVDAFAPADLAGRGAYSVRPRPNSVALNADNTHIAAGAIAGDNKDILVYKLGASVPVRTIALGTGDVVAPRGLAWSADDNRLFVISQHDFQPEPELSVFANATGS
jgi:YVTN family beta-propeller protein